MLRSFSLILPTIGRREEPERFLASLAAQTFRGFELVVVDQNPDDRLVPVVDAYEDLYPILHLRTKRVGASAARNEGLRYSRSDLVAFPDDDCRYPSDLLEKVARFFDRHPELDGLTGRLIDEQGQSSILDFDLDPGPLDTINIWTRSIEATMFLRGKSARRFRFDETLGRGSGTAWESGEGTDYLLQLLSEGASLYYEPSLNVIHPHPVPPYDAKSMRRAYEYGCGRGRVLRKHQYPLRERAKTLVWPLKRAVACAANLKTAEARYHWNVFRGRSRGLVGKANVLPGPRR
ncbi:MAG TPA: glycosyltransferase [Rubrobacteraceae bacterium]|nr:glycosyltransferase [Rubrobacteraceae bacterium]